MQIKILGTRGEIPDTLPRHAKHTGLIVDEKLLIDVGEKSFLNTNPKWILLTHFHPDHAYFVRHGSEEIPPATAPIYAPEIPAALKDRVTLIDAPMKIGPYQVIPIPTHHSKHVISQAYVVKKGRKSFLFTGDLVWIDKQYHSLIGEVDLVITEASFIRKGGMIRRDKETGQIFGHNGVPNLISLLKPFSNTILFMHFGSWFYENPTEARKKLQALGAEHGVHILVAHDNLTLTF